MVSICCALCPTGETLGNPSNRIDTDAHCLVLENLADFLKRAEHGRQNTNLR